MLIVGIDPDLHSTGVAGWSTLSGKVEFVAVIRVSDKIKGRDAAIAMCRQAGEFDFDEDLLVVEGQKIYPRSSKDRNRKEQKLDPNDLVNLALVAGAFVGRASKKVLSPLPSEWKGTTPKAIHQARVLRKLGWPSETVGQGERAYTRPVSGFEGVPGVESLGKEDWKHVVDAIGLAMWGGKK